MKGLNSVPTYIPFPLIKYIIENKMNNTNFLRHLKVWLLKLPSTFYELVVNRAPQLISLLRINTYSHVFCKWKSLLYNRAAYIGDKRTIETKWLKIFKEYFSIKIQWPEQLFHILQGLLGSGNKTALTKIINDILP